MVNLGSASELTSLRSPRDLNGYKYSCARLGWTFFGIRNSIVENYVLFGAVLHVAVALERNRVDPVVDTRYVRGALVLLARARLQIIAVMRMQRLRAPRRAS